MLTEAELLAQSKVDFEAAGLLAIENNYRAFPPKLRRISGSAIRKLSFQADLDDLMRKNAELYRRLSE